MYSHVWLTVGVLFGGLLLSATLSHRVSERALRQLEPDAQAQVRNRLAYYVKLESSILVWVLMVLFLEGAVFLTVAAAYSLGVLAYSYHGARRSSLPPSYLRAYRLSTLIRLITLVAFFGFLFWNQTR